jgi:hypothetical protein
VLKRKSFTFENTGEDAKLKWMAKSDPIFSYMEFLKRSRALVENPSGRVRVKTLYTYYTRYCNIVSENTVKQADFTIRIQQLGYRVETPKNISTLIGYTLIEDKLREALEKLEREERGEEIEE